VLMDCIRCTCDLTGRNPAAVVNGGIASGDVTCTVVDCMQSGMLWLDRSDFSHLDQLNAGLSVN